jgi:hypothetical protein
MAQDPTGARKEAMVRQLPPAEAGSLRAAWNDKAPPSGRLTAARQRRNPAASASSNAVRPPFYPGNDSCRERHKWSVGKMRCANRSLHRNGVLKHTNSIPPERGAALPFRREGLELLCHAFCETPQALRHIFATLLPCSQCRFDVCLTPSPGTLVRGPQMERRKTRCAPSPLTRLPTAAARLPCCSGTLFYERAPHGAG